jgi:hypothetical protein
MSGLPHQDAEIAPIQPVGWSAMLSGLDAILNVYSTKTLLSTDLLISLL